MTVITDINRIKQDQQVPLRAAQKISERASKEGRNLSGDELQQINGHMDEFEDLQKQVTTLERMEGIDPNSIGRQITDDEPEPGTPENVPDQVRSDINVERRWEQSLSEARDGFRDMSIRSQETYLDRAHTQSYNDGFYDYLRDKEISPDSRRELNHVRTMTEAVTADGGILAPTQLVQGIQRETFAYEQMKPRMDVIRSNARSLTYTKGLDAMVMGWVAELGTKPEDQVTFGPSVLTPHVGAVVTWLSDELVEDETFGLQGYLSTLVGEAKVLLEEEAFISGSGTGRPWGILTRLNGEGGTPNRYSTQVAATLSAQDIIRLPYTMPPQYRRNGTYIFGTNALRSIRLQRDDSGAGAGTGGFLWQPSLQAGEPATLNGYSVIESSSPALNGAIATGQDVGLFGDLRRYRVFERIGLQVKRLEELRALTDEVGFRFRFRIGGDVMYNAAFKTIRVL